MFTIIPAIDLMDGQCVRLFRGKKDEKIVYYDNPVDAALRWEAEGAKRIHVVDLDGAFGGVPRNFDVIKRIRENTTSTLEVGGGIRNIETIEDYLSIGIDRVIIGSKAVSSPEFVELIVKEFGKQVIVGIDAQDGKVAVEGWVEISQVDATEFAQQIERLGVEEIVFTNIKTDGTLAGPDLGSLKIMADSTTMRIIASGGISCLDDIRSIAGLDLPNVSGVIIGKAIYAGKVDLKTAIDKLQR